MVVAASSGLTDRPLAQYTSLSLSGLPGLSRTTFCTEARVCPHPLVSVQVLDDPSAGRRVVRVAGELDLSCRPEYLEPMREVVAARRPFVADAGYRPRPNPPVGVITDLAHWLDDSRWSESCSTVSIGHDHQGPDRLRASAGPRAAPAHRGVDTRRDHSTRARPDPN